MKSTHATLTIAALAALGLMGIGCGDDGGSSSGGAAPAPTQEQKTLVQSSEEGGGALDDLAEISTKALIDDGSGGAATKSSAPAGTSSASATVIAYQENVNLIIDLDMPNEHGNDAFPNATGQIGIAASGTIVGDPSAGSIEYGAIVTAITDLVFSDPVSACTATITAGGTFAHQVLIGWSWTDSQNWTISAEDNAAIADFVLTVTDGTDTWTATVDCARTRGCTITAVAGNITLVCAVAGGKFVTLSDGVETHFVAIDWVGVAGITVTVDGEAFGPWSAARVRSVFGVDVN